MKCIIFGHLKMLSFSQGVDHLIMNGSVRLVNDSFSLICDQIANCSVWSE